MNEFRRKAMAWRTQIGLTLDDPLPAASVVQAGLAVTGAGWLFPPPNDPTSAAHALAHLWLHGANYRCAAADLNPKEIAEPVSGAFSKVDGGSPQQQRENEANVFSAELLLPGPLARRLFFDDKLSSEAIAELLGLPTPLVQAQLCSALLLPPLSATTPMEPAPAAQSVALDDYQKQAAEISCGPLLLGAGPGTGKTKTLVGRCQHLTETLGVPAKQILALTFSRQAALEMRERLALAGVGTQGARPWVGTFHSFGLEILRRFGDRLGLSGDIKLLDTLDAVTLLENHLPQLQLSVLDNLYNPAISLGGIVKQISRAKDELCSPEHYAELCRTMQAQAERSAQEFAAKPGKKLKRDEEAVAKALEQAAKAKEVAHCYAVYETLMREHGYLDFADLISRSVTLLEEHPDVLATLQSEFPHVLADEYQDVNRACAHLVRLLAGEDARGLWAVGDHRQSIYRFRGASPANVAAFRHDYPNGQRLELGVNYRSRQPIVDLFGVAARKMETEEPAPLRAGASSSWHAHRGSDADSPCPAVTLAIASDEEGQADGIARAIEDLKAAGKAYRDQAILCRTHGQAEKVATLLSERDIPTLYLGALLDRPEVKDLLCLLSLFADKDGSGLLRVAGWPDYAIPQAEALALISRISFDQTPLLEALQDAALPDGLQRLGTHLAELKPLENDPAALMRHYLFGLSDYLHHLAANEPKPFLRMQRLMAIHHLLGLAETFDRRLIAPSGQADGPSKVREFLTHLRRLTASGESLRPSLPSEAETLDAVRILTAHAAKGLEYPVVFLPNLSVGQFPARGRHDGIPEPPGLADTAGQETDEEDCLFFVALSRARDFLIISRYETSGTDRAIPPSPLLELIRPWFDTQGVAETVWPSGRAAQPAEEAPALPPAILPTFSAAALETYLRCPRQFYYARELKLTGTLTRGGYPPFHACVRETLDWLEGERMAGRDPTGEEIEAKMEALWADHGPVGNLHEGKYKDSALQMLRAAARREAEDAERVDSKTLHVTLAHCRVRVRPDVVHLCKTDGTLVVARRLTGKPGDDDKNDKRLALFRRAAQESHPNRRLRLELRYLSDGTVKEIEPPGTDYKAKLEADRVAKYDAAARGIHLRQFSARPSDECQSCAYALICPL